MDKLRQVFEGAECPSPIGKIPTLKYLVNQSLRCNNNSVTKNENPDTEHLIFDSQDNENTDYEGSGDIASGTNKSFLETGEIDVNNFLSAAYNKGSQWLQAGLSLFGEEDDLENQMNANVEAENENAEEDENDVEVTEETFEVVSQSKKAGTDKIPPVQVDDTAYYNGYSIRINGQGIALDTLFVNRSGPSKKGVEIRVSLLRDPTPNLHATIHAFYVPDENKLTMKYSHGFVEGFIELTCPPHVNVNDVKNDHKGDYIVITAP